VKLEASVNIYWSSANANASPVISTAHRNAQIKARVNHHLPDKIIGKVIGMKSTVGPEGFERKNF
jgi:hypothetical protein